MPAAEIESQRRRTAEAVDLAEVHVQVRQLASTKSACAGIWLFAALVHDLTIVPSPTATPSLISKSVHI